MRHGTALRMWLLLSSSTTLPASYTPFMSLTIQVCSAFVSIWTCLHLPTAPGAGVT